MTVVSFYTGQRFIILRHFESGSWYNQWPFIVVFSFYVCTLSVCSIWSIISEIMCSTHLYGGMMYDYANCKAESHSVWDLYYTQRLVNHNCCVGASHSGCSMCYFTSPMHFPFSVFSVCHSPPLLSPPMSLPLHLSSTWFLIPTLGADTPGRINISATLMSRTVFHKDRVRMRGRWAEKE